MSTAMADMVKLFVGQVPVHMASEQLAEVFAEFGQADEISIVRDRVTGQSKGCAFVTYRTEAEARAAINALGDNRQLPGSSKPLVVKVADVQQQRHDGSRLFVASIPSEASEDALAKIFCDFGEVTMVSLHKQGGADGLQYAFIRFSKRAEASAAIAALHGSASLPGASPLKSPLVVKFAASRSAEGRWPQSSANAATESTHAPQPTHAGDAPPSTDHYDGAGHKLFVGMVPYASEEADIEVVFSQFGPLMEVFLMREKDGRSKGCAFVRYYSQQDADRACETLHNTVALPGCLRALVVKYADSETRASKQQPSHGAVPGYYPLQAPAGSQRFLGESQWVGMPGGGMGHLITPMHSPAMMGGMRMLPMGMLPAIDSQYYLPPRVVMPNGATYPVQTPFVSGMGGMGMGGMGMGGMGMDGMGMGRMPLSDLHCAEQQTHSFAPSFAPGRGFSPAGTPMSPMSPPPFAMWAPSAAASQPDSLNLLERQLSATSFSAGTPAEGARRGACWDRISVTNLPRHMQEADIHQLFAPFGMVQEIQLLRRPDGSSKGSALIVYRHASEGMGAARLHNQYLNGSSRPLCVRPKQAASGKESSSSGSRDKIGVSPDVLPTATSGNFKGGAFANGVVEIACACSSSSNSEYLSLRKVRGLEILSPAPISTTG